ncbi:MAG TPA: NADH-quinone oxidoreductase subunit NuoE [Armatimonadota bacterium]|jgi:NADH:ubiquinone oxidoreductase subunit E
MSYQREILEKPEWWQQLDEYIREQKLNNQEHVQSALIPVLHHIQDTFGYIPAKAINHVAQALGVPTSYVEGVASFYSYFSLTPKGVYTVAVCMGTACYVRGAQAVMDQFCSQLGAAPGETTNDGLFTMQCARCLGACGQAPVVMVNNKIHAPVKPEDVSEIVSMYTAKAREEVPA